MFSSQKTKKRSISSTDKTVLCYRTTSWLRDSTLEYSYDVHSMVRNGGGAGQRRRGMGTIRVLGRTEGGQVRCGLPFAVSVGGGALLRRGLSGAGDGVDQEAAANLPRGLVSGGAAAGQGDGLPRLFPRRERGFARGRIRPAAAQIV